MASSKTGMIQTYPNSKKRCKHVSNHLFTYFLSLVQFDATLPHCWRSDMVPIAEEISVCFGQQIATNGHLHLR
jgi:hypothetical protein